MAVVIGAVGRLKDGPEQVLFERYADRLAAMSRAANFGPIVLREVREARASSAEVRRREEAEKLIGACGGGSIYVVALDERGKQRSSEDLARFLGRMRDDGVSRMGFLIGGADGHGQAVIDGAQATMSLGLMTLPHGLARIVLVEQLYRAATILTGHPYHRG